MYKNVQNFTAKPPGDYKALKGFVTTQNVQPVYTDPLYTKLEGFRGNVLPLLGEDRRANNGTA